MALLKQLSIFVENKPGRLSTITKLLKDSDIDIRALSVADTKDFGILRLIVNKPDAACEALKAADCTVSITNVVAIGVKDEPGGLAAALDCLYAAGISVEYMYAFISKSEDTAYVILRVENNDGAVETLAKGGFTVIDPQEVYEL
jgi:hypothetical protein